MKKMKVIFCWLTIVAYLVFIPGFMWDKYRDTVCGEIDVRISGEPDRSFLQPEDILEIVHKRNGKLLGYPLSSINTKDIEESVNNKLFVKNADIYRTTGGRLVVGVEQRIPLLRVIISGGEDFYIDTDGVILPVSDRYSSHVLVAGGNISRPGNISEGNIIFNGNSGVLEDLFILASYIRNDPFWNSQIVQVYARPDNEYELIPRVGAHIIKFGDISGYEKKFRKLKALYEYGLPHKGWNSYEIINLKYENQVICTRR